MFPGDPGALAEDAVDNKMPEDTSEMTAECGCVDVISECIAEAVVIASTCDADVEV